MARMWVLVEWVDDSNVFPSYGVINIETFSYQDSDIEPGKQIFVSLKNNDPRRAKIIRLSDNKRQVKEHKDFLERQDQQVRNVLQLCMRTIKEMKSDQYLSNSMENSHLMHTNGQHNTMPHVIMANSENSGSESDIEVPQKVYQSKAPKSMNQTHQNVRYDPSNVRKGAQSVPINQRRRSIMSSTPVPGRCVQDKIKLFFDQGTQTDSALLHPSISKIEEIELVLKHLYGRFQSLVMKANSATVANETMAISENEQNEVVSYTTEANDSWATPNAVTENGAIDYNAGENNVAIADIGAEQVVETENLNENDIEIPMKTEIVPKNLNESMRVRRMSAQTTYSNEMVPIGNGRAVVPVRLLNDIDWTSYTTATRQLLQAIFPRKVLATHSLTGKQSPAHLNKPPKKLLDPNLVEDIIITVSTKSGVPKNLVRNSITVKCTDEAKLYRNRQRYQFSRSQQKKQLNDENIPPSATHSSDESLRL